MEHITHDVHCSFTLDYDFAFVICETCDTILVEYDKPVPARAGSYRSEVADEEPESIDDVGYSDLIDDDEDEDDDPTKFESKTNVEYAKILVDEMVGSDAFDWADIVKSVETQLNSDSPFISNRQWKALLNIAGKSRKDPDFLDDFEMNHPEAAQHGHDRARDS